MASFRSDNNSGLCPEALEAITQSAGEYHIAYAQDGVTEQAQGMFQDIFGDKTRVFFMATGTAANVLAIASLTEPWQRVICHERSHLATSESSAPERITGCRLSTISTGSSKLSHLDLKSIEDRLDNIQGVQPGVVTIANPTEFGEVYTPKQTEDICKTANEMGYRVHVDGARFACAVAHLGCDPRQLTIDAGVDAMTFGGAKNGLAIGEAVLFFHQGDGEDHARAVHRFPFLRKAAGHLVSKHRFLTAPFVASLKGNAWLKHAAYANKMAEKLSVGLIDAGYPLRFPTQANGVFVSLPDHVHDALVGRHEYYILGAPAWKMARFLMSFDTDPRDVEAVIKDISDAG